MIKLINIYKEVYFRDFCFTCEYEKVPDNDETCDYCLDHPVDAFSRKPVNYVKKENKNDGKGVLVGKSRC